MRLCKHCLHIDVCQYVNDTRLVDLIDAVADRLSVFFNADESEVYDAFWDGMEKLFSAKCQEASWFCEICDKLHKGRPAAWIETQNEETGVVFAPICEKCRTENYTEIEWLDDELWLKGDSHATVEKTQQD